MIPDGNLDILEGKNKKHQEWLIVGKYGSDSKESTCIAGDLGSIPELRRSPGQGNGYPLQYSGLENSIDYIAHGVA